jgi:hypothetical protein
MSKIKYAIVHTGQAHRDEILAVGLAIYVGLIGLGTRVLRRDPTEEELDNPQVLVLDVGGRKQPHLHNYDHHQLPRGTEECALSLLARDFPVPGLAPGFTFNDLFADRPWYRATVKIDALGPFAMAKDLGLDKLPPELHSPFEMAIIEAAGNSAELDSLVKIAAFQAIGDRVATALALRERAQVLRTTAEIADVDGVKVLFVPDTDNMGVQDFRDAESQDLGEPIAVCVSHDDRGAGLSLYRFADDPRVDFSKLDGREDIGFAHASGFIAKTKSRDDDWRQLVRLSLV